MAESPVPVLYLSHGAPPLVDDARWVSQLQGWARQLPKPTSILMVSAHWGGRTADHRGDDGRDATHL